MVQTRSPTSARRAAPPQPRALALVTLACALLWIPGLVAAETRIGAAAPAAADVVSSGASAGAQRAAAAPPAGGGSLQAPSLSASEIVARFAVARGGVSAWHGVRSLSLKGRIEAGTGDSEARSIHFVRNSAKPAGTHRKAVAAGESAPATQIELPFTMSMERAGKSRLELLVGGKTAVQVFDGQQGWKVRPFLNREDVEPFTAEETKASQAMADIEGPLIDAAAKGNRVELEGVEAVEGHAAYKLKVTLPGADVRHLWIDAQSFLDVKVDGVPRRMDGRLHDVAMYQRDFRDVKGVKVPFLIETVVDGYHNSHRMLIEQVDVNPRLDPGLFAKPKS